MSTNTQVEKKEVSKMEVLKRTLEAPSVQDQFKNALQENTGTFTASLIDLFGSDNYLQNCDPKDVVMEALKAAVLKLPIIKSLGFAYIVPFKTNNVMKPQFQLGYKGLIQLAMRTGQYRIINADMVYEDEYKTKNKLTGEYDLNGEATSDKIIGYFAHFEMLNGFSKTLYMTKEKVVAHGEKYSKSYSQPYGPWKKEFDGMAIKTVIRGLLGHWGFLSVEMLNAMNEEDTDVSEKIQEKINMNGNKKDMSFDNIEEAEQVQEFSNSGPGF